MKLMVSEIINKAKVMPEAQAIEFLRANDSVPLRHVLKLGLCNTIEILLPPGDPPYKPSEAVESQGMFYSEARKMYLFVRGGNDSLRPLKREMLFIQMLEAVHPEDAKMLLLMKDKKIPLSASLVNNAFPDLQIVPVPARVEVAETGTATKSKKSSSKKDSPVLKAVEETLADIQSVKETPASKKATKKPAAKKAAKK